MRGASPTFIAYAQLMRLPNVFTAVADPLAGWFVVGGGEPSWQLLLLVGASASLYTSGLVFNDCFDIELDRRERPERPLPSGAIPKAKAWALGLFLMMLGLAMAAMAGGRALGIGLFLAIMIVFYNGWAKRFFLLGPLALGTCRCANFMLGMRFAPPSMWWMPAVVGGYAAVLTFIARQETGNMAIRSVVKRMLLGIIVLDAALVAMRGDFVGAAITLTLLIPAIVLGKYLAMT